MTNETCPTCGQPVRIHQSAEGTGCYLPVESEAIRKHRDKGSAQYSNLFVWCVENLKGFPPIEGEWFDDVKARLMRSESSPSEEKIRAAFEAATEFAYLDKDTAGDYLDSDVWRDWVKFKSAYLAGWKDRGGE